MSHLALHRRARASRWRSVVTRITVLAPITIAALTIAALSVAARSQAALSIPTNTWVQPSAPAQSLRSGLAGTYDPRGWNHLRFNAVTGTMVLFDGYLEPPTYPLGNIYANAVWTYDPIADRLSLEKLNHWTHTDAGTVALPENSSDPTPYDRHAYSGMALATSRNTLYIWSGANNSMPDNYRGDMWAYSFAQHAWRQVSGNHPFTVFEQSMVYDPYRDKIILFGGTDTGYHDGTQTWIFDVKSELWTVAAPVVEPPARTGQSICFDLTRRVAWMFGGTTNAGTVNEMWRYDSRGNTWTQVAISGAQPSERRFANLAYDPKHDIMLLWGGVTASDVPLSDTWIFRPATRTWEQVTPPQAPGPLRNYAEDMDYDGTHDVFVLNQGGNFWLYRYAGAPEGGGSGGAAGLQFRLMSSNPTRRSTRMSFTLARDADVRIDLVDSLGRRVSTLVHGRYPAGDHEVDWAGGGSTRAPSGVYYARLTAEGKTITRRLVLVR